MSDEAKVLLRVVEDSAKPDSIDFCVSLFADPSSDWYKPDYKITNSGAVENMKDFCLGMLTASLNGARLNDLIARAAPANVVEIATLKQQVAKLENAVAEANKVQTKLNATLAERTDAMVKLSTSLAEKAIDRPLVVK